jgi:hypothetical protein
MTPMSQEEINAAIAQQIVDKYSNAFIAKFGQPAANQDWGFGNANAASRAFTRGVSSYPSKGSIQPTITFPKDCAASNFLDDVPEGVNKLPDNVDEVDGGTYYIDATTSKVQMNLTTGIIYVKGNVDLSSSDKFVVNPGTQIYLVKGSTLKLGTTSALNLKGDIYIAKDATLETAGHLKINSNSKAYNHGTISAGVFELNTTSFLYNVGTLEAESVNAESNPSYIVNDGIINCTNVVVNAGAVQNNAEWTVSGTTKINSNNSGWVNNGLWKTQNYAYSAGSENVINNCFLWVTEDFDMNISSGVGDFKMDSGCGVLTKNFYGGRNKEPSYNPALSGPFKIRMGQNSLFKVEETAVLEAGRGPMTDEEEGFGFFGPPSSSDGYAVFQAKNIVRSEDPKSWGAVTYSGNLYVSAETHFAQGDDGSAPHKIIIEKDGFSVYTNIFAKGFRENGKPSITIPETTCCPGFDGDDDEFDVRIIGEDLTPGDTDWDFNDVVFGVKFNDAGSGATCTLLAAGGTLPLRIATKGNPDLNNANDWVEVHSLFGVSTTTMVNTGGVSTTVDLKPTFDVTGISKTENGRDIKIYVNKGTKEEPNWIELKAEQGDPAAKLAVRKGFQICIERQNINDIYKRFDEWVSNPLIRWY